MLFLITRGAGSIGSHHLRRLFHDSWAATPVSDVVVLDELTHAENEANLDPVVSDPGSHVVVGDICDTSLVGQLTAGVDAIAHFAAESCADRSLDGGADVVDTQVLVQAAVTGFARMSTDEVYETIPPRRG